MQQYWYVIVLALSLGGMTYADYKYRLLWFWNWRLTGALLLGHLAIFVAWDVTLIAKGVIATNQAWVSGLHIVTPNLPVEEFLFLTLLGYQTALLWRWRCIRT